MADAIKFINITPDKLSSSNSDLDNSVIITNHDQYGRMYYSNDSKSVYKQEVKTPVPQPLNIIKGVENILFDGVEPKSVILPTTYRVTCNFGESLSIPNSSHNINNITNVQVYYCNELVECGISITSDNVDVWWNGVELDDTHLMTVVLSGE